MVSSAGNLHSYGLLYLPSHYLLRRYLLRHYLLRHYPQAKHFPAPLATSAAVRTQLCTLLAHHERLGGEDAGAMDQSDQAAAAENPNPNPNPNPDPNPRPNQ